MRPPNNNEIKQLAALAKAYPDAVVYLREWRNKELDQLPHVAGTILIAQGRCQVLKEIVKLLQDAPDIAAKLK